MKFLLISFIIIGIALSGCNNIPDSRVENYANIYMDYFKKGDFAVMYEMFYEKAAADMTYAKFEFAHRIMLSRLGNIKEIKKGRIIKANYSFNGNMYEIVYDVDFEKHKGVYGIKIFGKDNNLQIRGWYIDSEGLMFDNL